MTAPAAGPHFEHRIAAVRRFSRFYTRHLGLLNEHLGDTPFSLTEARVLYELAHRDRVTATELAATLDLDAGYLSRILHRFGEAGIVKKVRARNDARQSLLSLTARGQRTFGSLNQGSRDQVASLLARLSPADQTRVVDAVTTVESLLGATPAATVTPALRTHRIGDMGWVTSAHGAV